MAIGFKSPTPRHRFRIGTEKAALTRHFNTRGVPKSTGGRLLLASWNIANLGAQERTDGAKELIAHVLTRFDLIAVQEVNDDFKAGWIDVFKHLGPGWDYVMTDTAGNAERLLFVYRTSKVSRRNLFGELALRRNVFPKHTVNVAYRQGGQARVQTFPDLRFQPFDRNPFIGSFSAGSIDFTLVNCHLYFGGFGNSTKEKDRAKYARRVLEIFALAKWAEGRLSKSSTYDRDVILMGDMNVPAMTEEDSAYRALTRFGWQPLEHNTSKVGGTNLGNDKTYDQMTFAPRGIGKRIKAQGVFDFDNAVFKSLWTKIEAAESTKRKRISKFNAHVKHHISDHRPLWTQLDIE